MLRKAARIVLPPRLRSLIRVACYFLSGRSYLRVCLAWYLARLRMPARRISIEPAIWVAKIRDKCISPHETVDARAANGELLRRLDSSGPLPCFAMEDGSRLHIPDLAGSELIAVNDLREIYRESIYQQGAVSLKPGDVVIDCGANLGAFAALAARRVRADGVVVCVEPVPSLLRILDVNLVQNSGSMSYRVVDRPVFRDERWMELEINDCFTMHRLWMDAGSRRPLRSLRVLTTTIDSLVEELALPRVDFVKMDIEGAEMDALEGAAGTLARWKPRLAISAYHAANHFLEIPRLVVRLNPQYRISVRRALGPMCYAW